jgi:integrase
MNTAPKAPKNTKKRGNGEGTIFKSQRRNRWVVACYDYKGIRRTESFKKKIEAEAWLAEQIAMRMRSQGTYVPKPKETVEEFLANWLFSRRHQIRPNSYRSYDSAIRNFINPYIGMLQASTLTEGDIEAVLNTLADKGYGHGSIVGVIRTLSKAYNDGMRKKFQLHNPATGVQMLSMKPVVSRAIPARDLDQLYATALQSPYDLARLMVGAEIGIRPSEIMGLMWNDISGVELSMNVERQVQRVKGMPLHFAETKTDRLGPIPLTERQMAILINHHRHQMINRAKWKIDTGVIFPNKVGNLQDETSDKEWMRNLCIRAGIPLYTRYQLRKTAFTNFLKGADIGTTKAFSGHTSTKTLEDHYITPESSAVREAANRAEKALLNRQHATELEKKTKKNSPFASGGQL